MNTNEIIRLYYRYKRTDKDAIQNFLKEVKLVKLCDKGVGTLHGYYEITGKRFNELFENPRNKSLTFDIYDENGGIELGEIQLLSIFKEITFLVKSSSRFFYKPDIGEIIDAISFEDKFSGKITAIDIDCSNYELLPETDGEHFLCRIKLLTK